MVSDASSGPPHFPDEDEGYYYFNDVNGHQYHPHPSKATTTTLPNNNGVKKQKKKDHRCRQSQQQLANNSFLDDTASSPVINFSSKWCKGAADEAGLLGSLLVQ
ncbi:hypothetical protein EZV62_011077 [Acer yangbiense]|uniref:Uncharacterized protein n=1 Tax=Acer yangbiense TaxID=1000413 RepID=A0A5C7I3H9_9ROSI|nr:hypothetical protein EZV62_011077 [Acer yangbiense]